MLTIDLFAWWTLCISWNIAFLIVAGLYLYASSRTKRKEDTRKEAERKMNDEHSVRAHEYKTQLKTTAGNIAKDFVFIWILVGLLIFYIFSVQLGTGRLAEVVFALGNIFVEALLVFYLFRNREKKQLKSGTKSE